MQAIIAPACAEVGGDRRLVIVRAMFAPERAVEWMQNKVDNQRVGAGVGILQRFVQSWLRDDLLVAQGLSDGGFVCRFTVLFFVQAAIVRTVQTVAPVADEAVRQDPTVITAMTIVVGAGKR